jgi:hypothetical protein
MSNTLTGDFDAVLELNGGTLRRLVAGMHQNGFGDSAKPNIPHVAHCRLAGDSGLDAEHGSVSAQIGVPYLHLINGATDRVRAEIGVRAHYSADPGSARLADIIHGTIWADYEFRDIDPSCWGWRGIAADYLWLRVVPDSVVFDGTVFNESHAFDLVGLLDEPVVQAHITKHVVYLLSTSFAPQPQRVDRRFRKLRCLVHGDGPADSAIAIPYGLHGEIPGGNLASLGELFLQGHDFGLAVSSDYILSQVQPMLDPIAGQQVDIFKTWDAGAAGGMTLEYHARADTAAAAWLGPFSLPYLVPSAALIRVRVTGVGWCSRLYRSGVYNIGSVNASDLGMTFTADQLILLTFNGAAERFSVNAFGPPGVVVNYNGPYAGDIKPAAAEQISATVAANVGGALSQAQNGLNALPLSDARASLSQQVQRLVENGAARFDNAAFRMDGVALLGTISVAYRYPPQVSFQKTPLADGFDAIQSWIPGGRVDRFDWSWSWYSTPIEKPPGPPGSEAEADSFFLRRPQGARSRYGMTLPGEKPLPGLDGWGRVCLTISGGHVDSVTGAWVPLASATDCAKFGYEFKLPYEVNGPYVRVCDPLHDPQATPREVGIVRVGVSQSAEPGSNTLVVYVNESWNEPVASALAAGLERCRRGYGLRVVLLFRDGALSKVDAPLQARLRQLAKALPAPLTVSEDVYEGWRRVLSIPAHGGPAWRLLSPDGLVTWARDGPTEADLVASALEQRLQPAHPPGMVRLGAKVGIGARFPVGLEAPPCPPVPLGSSGRPISSVVFVRKEASSTRDALDRLVRQTPAEGAEKPFIAVVVENATARDIEELRARWGLDLDMLPDPNGDLTRRAGVQVSPTTMTIDCMGNVAAVQMGVD